MKCPYNGFKDCIVEKCPACVYEVAEEEIMRSRGPIWMNVEEAMVRGYAWKEKKTKYIFKACRLADNNVRPPDIVNQVIDNKTSANVVTVKKSLF